MYSEPPLRQSLQRVADVLGHSGRAIDQPFRSRLAKLGFTPAQRREIEKITPGAVAKAWRAAVPPQAIFSEVQERGRTLALHGAEQSQVIRAIGEHVKLTRPLFRQAAANASMGTEAARSHVHCLLIAAINDGFASVQTSENDFLRNLLHMEATSTGAPELNRIVLSSAIRHFGATDGALIAASERQLSIVCQPDGKLTTATGKRSFGPQLEKVLYLKSGSRLILVQEWTGAKAVWSIPVAGMIMQLAFGCDRPLMQRESRLLKLFSESWGLAIHRMERERHLHGLSLKMLEVEELERRRVSRELHDDAGQSLVVIRLQLEMLELGFPDANPEMKEKLAEIRELTEKTILSVRKLISVLSPAVLEQLGLAAAVRQMVNRFRLAHNIRVKVHIGKLPELHFRLALVIYRVLQECFNNIALHSRAGQVNVSLSSTGRHIRLSVADNGVGFDVEEGVNRRNCYGLIGIRERVRLLGGTFLIESHPLPETPHGTTVSIKMPLTDENLREVSAK